MNPARVLTLQNIQKGFVTERGERVHALDSINLDVFENEFVCIVGPSGCGKSTLLRIMAGLDTADSGQALYRDKLIERPRKEIGMVFQEYSLLPWRTVLDNVALGLEFSGVTRKERADIAQEYLGLVHMQSFAHAFPYELSGGMRQRVAIARALANKPDILLMDEPFGALDAHTRILLQRELLRIWEQYRTTIVFVTHGVDEAVYLADHIIVMSARPGRIAQRVPITLSRTRERSSSSYARLTAEILDMIDCGMEMT